MEKNFVKKRPQAAEEPQPAQLRNRCRAAEDILRECLCGVFGSSKPLDRILGACFRNDRKIGSQDRRFIGEGVYSVFRHWGVLRKLLCPELRESVERGEPAVRLALGALLYGGLQLAGLEFSPMEVYRGSFGYRFLPCANDDELSRGRKFLQCCQVAEPLEKEDLFPQSLADELVSEVTPEEVVAFAPVRPPVYLRSQGIPGERLALALRNEGIEAQLIPELPNTLRVSRPGVNFSGLELFRKGLFEVQDVSSQLIGLAAAPRRGERWLDLCAGAGGKSLQLAELMERRGTVVACDIRSYKLEDLRRRARRAGFPNIECRSYGGGELPRNWHGKFDGVLVDAPCSCSGVWRRNPDGRWRCRTGDIAAAAALQHEILERACKGVKTCGVLIYATCSIFEKENRGVVTDFLAAHPEFKLDSFAHPAGGEMLDGMLQSRMSDFDGDAMFVARMKRK